MSEATRVLLIEDDTGDAQMIGILLARSAEVEATVEHVTTLGDAIASLYEQQFDVLIVDLCLPDNDGLAALPRLKACAPGTPIVVLTGHDDAEMALDAIRYGAQEYLSKEHMMGHLLARVIRHSMARQRQLRAAQEDALTDTLTRIANRRCLEMELDRRFADFRRHKSPLSLTMLDVDYFKRVNDTWGHDAGDQVLRALATTLTDETRETDLVARYGGEEFVIVMPATPSSEACGVVETVRSAIGRLRWPNVDSTLSVTISGGLAEAHEDDDPEQLLRRADRALYAAKANGRDRSLFCQRPTLGLPETLCLCEAPTLG